MKKIAIPFVCLLLLAVILCFPVKKRETLSGPGEILTADKEKIGDCHLSVEVTDLRSLLLDYRRTFSFTADSELITDPASIIDTSSFWEADGGLCSITQAYYDASENRVEFGTMLYQKDLSYAAIWWNDRLYFLPNGTEMTADEIPWQIKAGE